MPVNVHVGFSRKVGEPNYGSRGASVHLELELDRTTLDDPARLQTEIEAIFERARSAVDRELDRELERPASPPLEGEGACVGPPDQTGKNGHRPGPRPATPHQVRALERIACQRGVDLTQLLYAKFDGRRAEELSLVEASLLIDFLKATS
jgi:hypothetical protein